MMLLLLEMSRQPFPPPLPHHVAGSIFAPDSKRMVMGVLVAPLPCATCWLVIVPHKCTVVPGLILPEVDVAVQSDDVPKKEIGSALAQDKPFCAPDPD